MTYSKNSLVEAADYNSLATSFNNIWGTGLGNKGLGQSTVLPSVSTNATVSSTEWTNLANGVAKLGNHQGSILTSLPTFSTGNIITYVAALQTNLTTLNTNAGWAAAQGTTTLTKTETTTSWNTSLTFTQTITFDSGDKARYFFNAGGQIVIQPNISTTSTAQGSVFFRNLAQLCGSWVISGTGGKIVGSTYTPFTKIGGTAAPASINTNLGYYGLTTSYQKAIKIMADGSFGGTSTGFGNYGTNSFIELNVKSNGTQGINNDAGNVITVQVIFDEIPNGLLVSGTSSVTCLIKPPSISYVANTWGTVFVEGSVTGS